MATKEIAQTQNQQPHIAFLCGPSISHIIPFVELAKPFIDHHGFSVTLLTFTNFSTPIQSSFLASLPPSVDSIIIPLISLDDLPPSSSVETRFCVLSQRSVPYVRSALLSLEQSKQLIAFVADFFCSDALPIAKELNIPHYIFDASNFTFLAYMLNLPHLHETTTCHYHDLPEPLRLPGCVPLWAKDFFEPVRDRTSEVYNWILRLAKGYANAEGFLINSFDKLEPETAKAFKDGKYGSQSVYTVGPLVRSHMSEAERDEFGCLAWLEKQPARSVLFITFGNWGTFSTKQMNEIAFGLEKSGHRFLWVVRAPNDKKLNGSISGLAHEDNPLSYLPKGFMERTKEVGMVVPSRAPQVKILSHKATGGFLSHCGWNSTLESVCHGVPMIAWPLYAEQHMNAVMLVEGTGIALGLKQRDDGLVETEEIVRVIRDLMEGEKGNVVRSKVRKLQVAGTTALTSGGASYQALEALSNKWKKKKKNATVAHKEH